MGYKKVVNEVIDGGDIGKELALVLGIFFSGRAEFV